MAFQDFVEEAIQTAFRTTDYGPNHLPRDRDGIPRDLLVTAHENEVLDLSLRDENPVERVPVMVGQRRDVQRVPEVNRQDLKAVDRHVFGHEVFEVLRQPQPSNPRLDRKLPSACDTQEAPVPLSRDQLLSQGQQLPEKVVHAQLACLPVKVVEVERLAVGGLSLRAGPTRASTKWNPPAK